MRKILFEIFAILLLMTVLTSQTRNDASRTYYEVVPSGTVYYLDKYGQKREVEATMYRGTTIFIIGEDPKTFTDTGKRGAIFIRKENLNISSPEEVVYGRKRFYKLEDSLYNLVENSKH